MKTWLPRTQKHSSTLIPSNIEGPSKMESSKALKTSAVYYSVMQIKENINQFPTSGMTIWQITLRNIFYELVFCEKVDQG